MRVQTRERRDPDALERAAYLLLALVCSVAIVVAAHVVDLTLSHDGPQHVYLGYLGNHFTDPGAVYPTYYKPAAPLSALGFTLLFGPLEAAFGWREATRLVVALLALLWSWGVWTLVSVVRGRQSPLSLVGFATALSWPVYMGFFSFALATAIGLFTLALALVERPWTRRRWLALGALLLWQALLHVFAAALTSALVGVLAVGLAPRERRWAALGWAFLALLPVGVIGLASSAGLWGGAVSPASPDMKLYSPDFGQRLGLLAGTFAGGPAWRAWPPIILALAGIGLAIQRSRTRSARGRDCFLLAASVGLFALAVITPLHTWSWNFLSPRFIPGAVALGWVLVDFQWLGRRAVRVGAAILVTAFVGASSSWAVSFQKRIGSACADLLLLLDEPVRRQGPRLPIVLDTRCGLDPIDPNGPMPFLEPALNIGQLFAVEQGGVVPYTFTKVPQLHPFVMADDGEAAFPPVPDRLRWWSLTLDPVLGASAHARRLVLTHLASYGSHYEDVIFWGTPADAEALIGLGYSAELRRGGAMLARFRGCPLDLEIVGPPGAEVLVEYGWQPVEERFWSSELTLGDAEAGLSSVRLPKTPCGEIWASVRRTGASTGGCRGADSRGRLSADTRSSKIARCDLR